MLNRELKAKDTDILKLKDKKQKYKRIMEEQKKKCFDTVQMYYKLIDVNEERVRREYETPDRQSLKGYNTPIGNTSRENSLGRKSNREKSNQNCIIKKEISIKLSKSPIERSPER
jgi:hypothetical protein